MVLHSQVRVNVLVSGKRLPEYAAPSEEQRAHEFQLNNVDLSRPGPTAITKTTLKYLEATPNAEYQIQCAVDPKFDFGRANSLSIRVFVDGRKARSMHVNRIKCKKQGGWRGVVRGFHQGAIAVDAEVGGGGQVFFVPLWCLFPFRWEAGTVGDQAQREQVHSMPADPSIPHFTTAELEKRSREIGTVRVEVWRKIGRRAGRSRIRTVCTHEKEPWPRRAISVGVSTKSGFPGRVKTPYQWLSRAVDDAPVLRFIYNYRTRDHLKDLGIIPHSPVPALLEERDPANMTREELVELARCCQAGRSQEVVVENEETQAENAKTQKRFACCVM